MSLFSRLAAAVVALVVASAAHSQDPLKVGFVYIGPVGEAGWTFSHDAGRRAIERKFGARVKTSFVEGVKEGAEAERVIRNLARQGHQLVFATSSAYGNAMARVAREFPKVRFEHATGEKTASNLAVYDARTYEGAYLAGLVAGRLTRSGKLGVVASIPIPEVIRNINAFTLGARQSNPDVSTRVAWVNKWFDPGKEREAALSLIDQGADVLMQNTDSPAVVQAASEQGVYAFGRDSDMTRFGPRAHLAAASIDWGVYYTRAVGDMLEGRWKAGDTWWGVKEGMIDLTHLNAVLPEDVRGLVATRKAEIVAGTASVFSGPILDQKGVERLPGGKAFDDRALRTMKWYVQGVEGNVPR